MVSIKGVGFSYPDTIIDNNFLRQIGGAEEAERLGIAERRTILPLPYVLETKNSSPEISFKSYLAPSGFAHKASEAALQAAGLQPDALRLIVGNGETARETTPSEAQRVGKLLGVRVPAYDITISPLTLIAHLDIFNGWKQDKLPQEILSVSAATMTAVVDYSDPRAAARFGDAAGAAIISAGAGRLKVLDTSLVSIPSGSREYRVESYGHIVLNPDIEGDVIAKYVNLISQYSKLHSFDWNRDALILDSANSALVSEVSTRAAVPLKSVWRIYERFGDTAGAGLYGTLALNWNQIAGGQKIMMLSSTGDALWGAAILQAED